LGLFGGIDAVGVGAVWATMFLAIRNRAGSDLGTDPKRICVGAASGIARYYRLQGSNLRVLSCSRSRSICCSSSGDWHKRYM
jgi:hypothetical protein